MSSWLEIILAVFASVLASSGLWSYILYKKERRDKKKDDEDSANSAECKMLLGLGHDRIVSLCLKYIERGWVSSDEHEDLLKYLYEPYNKLGGNGTAKRLVEAVNSLPIHKMTYMQQVQNKNQTNKYNNIPPTPQVQNINP
jgi:hypothetical protein